MMNTQAQSTPARSHAAVLRNSTTPTSSCLVATSVRHEPTLVKSADTRTFRVPLRLQCYFPPQVVAYRWRCLGWASDEGAHLAEAGTPLRSINASASAGRTSPRRVPPDRVGTSASRSSWSRAVPFRQPQQVALAVRMSLLVLAVLESVVQDRLRDTLPWLLALGALMLLARHRERTTPSLLVATSECGVACAGAVVTGGVDSALLVYLPAAALAAGLTARFRAVLAVAALGMAILLLGQALLDRDAGSYDQFVAEVAQWVALALVVGLIGAWGSTHSAQVEDGAAPRYAEAYDLLDRLRAVTRQLPGTLDPGSSAEQLLRSCIDAAPATQKGAVLHTAEPGQLVPLAVHGARRVPWRSPLTEPGPLRRAYLEGRTVLDVRPPDPGGRREGSALLVVPIAVKDRRVGLLILESGDLEAYAGVVPAVQVLVDQQALQLDTALLFDEVRSLASLQERERLAQDMHDGVAQDLAYVGFELDSLRHQLSLDRPDLALEVATLRKQMTSMVSDLRLSITSLRSGLGQERGLGEVLTSYARRVAAARGLAVHLTLEETAFRLPGETEVQLFKVAQEVIATVRGDSTVQNLWITLTVDPPSARLRLEHDGDVGGQGAEAGLDLKVVRAHVERLGAAMLIEDRTPAAGLRLVVALEGEETR